MTLRITRAFLGRINGAPETTVRITFLDERDQPREVTIVRERLKGEMSERLGNFPPQYTEFEAKRLADGAGYIRFNGFVMSLMMRIKAGSCGLNDAPRIHIGLRGNPRGGGRK